MENEDLSFNDYNNDPRYAGMAGNAYTRDHEQLFDNKAAGYKKPLTAEQRKAHTITGLVFIGFVVLGMISIGISIVMSAP